MLFAMTGMVQQGVRANLLRLGAIDFELIVDHALIIVENCLGLLAEEQHRRRPINAVAHPLGMSPFAPSRHLLRLHRGGRCRGEADITDDL